MTAEETAARIDRDRREREDEILLILLALFNGAYLHTRAAVRVGADPFAAATDVLMGNPALGLSGLPVRLAPAMLRASYAGWRRTVLMVPGDYGRPPGEGVGEGRGDDDYSSLWLLLAGFGFRASVDYRDRARQATGQMLATLLRRIAGGVSGGLSGVREAFETWGYRRGGEHGAWALEATATALGIASYEDGYAAGLSRDEVRDRLYGLRYVSVIDERTSEICHAYDHVRLPADHRWWLTHWPQNHNNCRASIVPAFSPFAPTPEDDIPWSPPPQAGFGRAPDAAYGFTLRQVARVA